MTSPASRQRSYVDFVVLGTPVAQGSMIVQRGRVRHSDSDRLNAWRNAIKEACLSEMRRETLAAPIWQPWDGPVELSLYFVYKPAKKAQSVQSKDTAPDLDKLVRAVLDALTGVLYVDDRQVVALDASKRYGEWLTVWDGGPETTSLLVNAKLIRERGL